MIRLIGRGAMGQIYLAEDTRLERQVAVKFIASVRPDASARQRFDVEARALARLSHPNVVAVHRVGEVDGRPYLIAEFVRGRTLAELSRPMAWERALRIGLGLARGLAAAHRQGVLHRDIKPANVMVTEDEQVKLLDFGLARLLEERPEPAPGGASPVEPAGAARGVTGAGGMVGTPLYMAPETLLGEPATRRSDLYSLGAVLYELCTGVAPRQTVSQEEPPERWMTAEPAPLLQLAPGVEPRLAALISRCLLPDPQLRFASAEELCGALDEVDPARSTPVIPEGNPYRGLRPFEAEHRALFFGRGAEIRTVLERLRTESLLVVAGDSGVGKSSLCRAGVLPLVVEEGLGDGRRYRPLTLVPGRRPLAALSSALSSVFGAPLVPAERLLEDPRALGEALDRMQAPSAGTLLFMDQLEELFTQGQPEESACMGEVLAHLAVVPGVRILLAVRGDYFTRLAALPGLGEEVSRALYLLRPLSLEATRAAITGPARHKGFHFESEALVSALAASAARTAGALPLLQFAMAELWEAREQTRHVIPASALEALGGVSGALARHADGVLEGLLPEQRRVARHLLPRLVTAEGTRARLTGVELGSGEPLHQGVLDALVRGRLLVASEVEGGTAYEVAHEALLQGWGTLRAWLETDGERRVLRERIEAAAAEWARLHQAREALWSERQLAEVERIDAEERSPRGARFLRDSRTRARTARYTRRALVALVPLALGLVLGAIRLQARWNLERDVALREQEAEGPLQAGRQEQREASELRRQAYASFDKEGRDAEEAARNRREAEESWERALKAAEKAELELALAGRSLEAALALDPSDERIRRRVGEVLEDRITLAEEFHQRERHKALAQWLEYLVPGRKEWLHAPPRLSVETEPPGAEVVLERYAQSQGPARPVSEEVLGKTPLRQVILSGGPGSYRLLLKAPGHAPVYYPVLLQRGEALALRLALPREERVPAGFVYVPPGRFLLGSADPEGRRLGMLRAPPLHETSTGAFLISRTETTFRDWLQFLAELPPSEREQLTPFARLRDWGLELKQLTGGAWSLTLTLNKRPLTVREGELLRLPDRSHQAVQDWSQLPVSAVSYEDALRYFEWLDRTGRVPKARFCTEKEWERAARGADGRIFPHGDLLAPEDANFDETYGRRPYAFGPDEVGSHPESVSPFGLQDMVGNVYELTRSMWLPGEVVIRGGSWYYDSVSALTANRTMLEPRTRDMGTGLRVCADAPPLPP